MVLTNTRLAAIWDCIIPATNNNFWYYRLGAEGRQENCFHNLWILAPLQFQLVPPLSVSLCTCLFLMCLLCMFVCICSVYMFVLTNIPNFREGDCQFLKKDWISCICPRYSVYFAWCVGVYERQISGLFTIHHCVIARYAVWLCVSSFECYEFAMNAFAPWCVCIRC